MKFECQYTGLTWENLVDLPKPVAALVASHIDDCGACRGVELGQQIVSEIVKRVRFEQAPDSLRLSIHTKIVQLSIQISETASKPKF